MVEKISAVVVTYNKKDLLSECIYSLVAQTQKLSSIIIIDNNSNDGTKETVQQIDFDGIDVVYKKLPENVGGAGGFYEGINEAYDLDNDFLWIMDDDTIPEKDALKELMKASKELDNFGFLASYVKWLDGTPCKMNIPEVTEDWLNDIQNTSLIKLKRSTFVSLLLPKSIITTYGLPLREFFIWGDDSEYTTRISNSENCYFVKDSIVLHKMKANKEVNILEDDAERLDRYFYSFRNRVYLNRVWGTKKLAKYFASIIILIWKLLFTKTSNKTKKLKLLIKGTWRGIFFRPTIVYPEDKQ